MTYSDLTLIGKIAFRAMAATNGILCRLIRYVYTLRRSRKPKA
jgi:hypothetical protein